MATLRLSPPDRWPLSLRWIVLLCGSAAIAAALWAVHIPAALLLGPMIAAVAMAAQGANVMLSKPVFRTAQGIVGVMIAANLPITIFGEVAQDWPIFLAGTLSTLLASAGLGWALMRSGLLPGTTAIWGSAPGAATAMVIMSESFGADMRLVAVLQYSRVVACALAATLAALVVGNDGTGSDPGAASQGATWAGAWFPILFAIVSAWIGARLKIPGGQLLLPMLGGLAAKMLGAPSLALPEPILAAAYAVVGWAIGMRFTAAALRHAARVMPRVIGGVLALLALCTVFAAGLVWLAGIDPLTAFLATSPGGADSVAIIAVSTHVDVPFVMAMQVVRFLLVLILGPMAARALSRSALKRGEARG